MAVQKIFLDFNFHCHGNKKLNPNNGCNKLSFLCNNVKGLQTSKTRLKLCTSKIKYFPMVFYSYKKRIPQRRIKLSGKTSLTIFYTFHMVNKIRVEH